MNICKVVYMYSDELLEFVIKNPATKSPGDLTNIIISGSVGLYPCYEIAWLPDNLTVLGDLVLSDIFTLQALPKGLFVAGNLYICGTSIKEIPEDMEVYGDIHAEGMELIFPESFRTNRSLYLNREVDSSSDAKMSPLKLPKVSLKVGGDFDISNRSVETFPMRLKVDGRFILSCGDPNTPGAGIRSIEHTSITVR